MICGTFIVYWGVADSLKSFLSNADDDEFLLKGYLQYVCKYNACFLEK